MPQPSYTTSPQKEAIARENGFASYEAMMLFQSQRERQQEAMRRGKAGQPQPKIRGQTPPPPPPNPKAQEIMSWHPAVVFNKIAQVLGMANSSGER